VTRLTNDNSNRRCKRLRTSAAFFAYVKIPFSKKKYLCKQTRQNKTTASGIYIKQNYMLQEFCSSLSGEFIAKLAVIQTAKLLNKKQQTS